MKKIRSLTLLLSLLIIAILASGCSLYRGQSLRETNRTKVDLEAKNFKVRKLGAQGNASCGYLFGIPLGGSGIFGIPMYNQNVQTAAIERLHESWDGKGSCFFHNINSEWTNYGLPFILVFHQFTITADIYEFDDEYVDYRTRNR